MRKPNSLFDQVCSFINDQPIGSTFKVQDIYNSVDEVYTRWKRSYNDPGYTTRLYCGYLRHAKVLCKYKRGTWTVLAHIPKDITLDKINGNCDFFKRWQANTQVPNDIVSTPFGSTPESQTIIIYKIVDKHVEPSEVLKTQVSALLSTGNYFEDELDAWYFLSIGTGVAVESLKSTWKKTQDFANDLIAFEVQAENTENSLLLEAIERLDGLLPIRRSGWSDRIKIWYGIKEGTQRGPYVFKYEVRQEQVCKNNIYENESLINLLKQYYDEVGWEIEDIIDNSIDVIEDDLHNTTVPEIKTDSKFIQVEDLRNKECYFKQDGEYVKGIVYSYTVKIGSDGNIEYDTVIVKYSVLCQKTLFYHELKFSKEEIIKEFAESLNSL